MAKTATKTVEQSAEVKTRKTPKEKKEKGGNRLVGRVKKAIKKTKRKLSDDKFEKELKRTITFLEELQAKISKTDVPVGDGKDVGLKTGKKAAVKVDEKAVNASGGNGVNKSKRKSSRAKKTAGRAPKRAARPIAS